MGMAVGSTLMLLGASGAFAGGGNLQVGVGPFSGQGSMSTGTGVSDTKITNKSKNGGAKAVSVGEGSHANVGHVGIQGGAYVSGGTIIDQSENQNSKAVAVGKNSEANVGGVDIR